MTIDKAANHAREQRAAVILLDLRPGRLHQFTVLHSRRACRFTGATIQTLVNMPDKGVAERQPSFIHEDHLPNAPARRIRFKSPQAISGAMIQTEAAMNAVKIVDVLGAVRTAETTSATGRRPWLPSYALRKGLRHRAQMPPRNRPGERMLCGSKTCLSRRASSPSLPAGGQTPRVFLISWGQRSIMGAVPEVRQGSISSREQLSNSGYAVALSGGKR